jgi:hypothetical protein
MYVKCSLNFGGAAALITHFKNTLPEAKFSKRIIPNRVDLRARWQGQTKTLHTLNATF